MFLQRHLAAKTLT